MRSKIADFYAAVALCDYYVVVIVETWLIPSILETELSPTGWQVFRRDRHRSETATNFGSGVLVLARDETLPTLVTDLVVDGGEIEQLWVRLSFNGHHLYVGAANAPPRPSSEVHEKVVDPCEQIVNRLGDADDLVLLCPSA